MAKAPACRLHQCGAPRFDGLCAPTIKVPEVAPCHGVYPACVVADSTTDTTERRASPRSACRTHVLLHAPMHCIYAHVLNTSNSFVETAWCKRLSIMLPDRQQQEGSPLHVSLGRSAGGTALSQTPESSGLPLNSIVKAFDRSGRSRGENEHIGSERPVEVFCECLRLSQCSNCPNCIT